MIPAWLDGQLVPMDAGQVHRLGLRHKAVAVIVADDDRLLLRRAGGGASQWSTSWHLHLHWGETPDQAARRCLTDMLGLARLYPIRRDSIECRSEAGPFSDHEQIEIYLACALPGTTVAPAPNGRDTFRWAGLFDLAAEAQRHPDRFAPALSACLTHRFDSIFSPLTRR